MDCLSDSKTEPTEHMGSILAGKTVVIVGGSSGIGLAAAHVCIGKGASVIVGARNHARLTDVVQKLGPRARCAVTDLTNPESLITFRDEVVTGSCPDILVVTAGTQVAARTISQLTRAEWNLLNETYVTGLATLIATFVPVLLKAANPHVIVVSSVAASMPSAGGGVAYSAYKHAVRGLVGALRLDPELTRIRFSMIAPGPTDTGFVDYRDPPVSDHVRASMLRPETVAEAIAFVASLPHPAFIDELVLRPAGFIG